MSLFSVAGMTDNFPNSYRGLYIVIAFSYLLANVIVVVVQPAGRYNEGVLGYHLPDSLSGQFS